MSREKSVSADYDWALLFAYAHFLHVVLLGHGSKSAPAGKFVPSEG